MKTVKIIASCLLFAVVCSCSSNKKKTDNDLIKRNLKGAVKSVKEEGFELILGDNELTKGNKTLYSDPDVVLLFNKDGFLTRKQVLNPDGSIMNTYIYEYDKKNQLVKETKYTATENIDRVFTYVYKDGKLESQTINTALGSVEYVDKYSYPTEMSMKQESFDKSGNLMYFFDYEYDKNKNMTKKDWHVNNNIVQTLYVYDDKNQLMTQTEINENEIETKWEYAYDEYGNVIVEITTFFDGSQLRRDMMYEFDAQGNWIIKLTFENDNPLFVTERTIEYY